MNIRTVIFFLVIATTVALFSSCYYDKASLVYPGGNTCDTSSIQLSTDLNDIMSANCYSCHSSSNAPTFGGNYNLQDYNTIKNAAANGQLLSSIKQDGTLAEPMPQSGPKLSDCEISKFSAWINSGFPNN